jgi:Zn-dependent alcohol dehydrogenase
LRTKGALVWEVNEPWSIDEIEIGDPRRGEVTVENLAVGDHVVMSFIPMSLLGTFP